MKQKVVKYLVDHFQIQLAAAQALVDNATDEIRNAERWASQPYYPGDAIALKNGLEHRDPCATCQREAMDS